MAAAEGQRAIFTAATMSLIRSLLPLAALLAITTAQNGDNCVTHTFGQVTHKTVPLPEVIVPPPGGKIDVPINECGKYGYGSPAIGEQVTACNVDGKTKPKVYEQTPGELTPLVVVCTDCPAGVRVDIVLYCPDPSHNRGYYGR